MAAFAFYLYPLYFIQHLLVRGCLSAPTTSHISTQNRTNDDVHALLPSLLSLNGLTLPNLTLPLIQESGIPYAVPNSHIMMFFHLGFHLDEVATRHTIDAARNYCDQQIETGGDGPLPRTEQPFHDDLGYGASIFVVSSSLHYPITWGILREIIQGLWDFLVVDGRYVEAEFDVFYRDRGTVARGSITQAPKSPTSRASA